MIKFRYFLTMCALVLASHPVDGLTIKEDAHYIYTTRGWAEIVGERQKDLIKHFTHFLQNKLTTLQTPHHWSNAVQKTFFSETVNFDDIIADIESQASSSALAQSIGPADLVATGFLIGFGVSGSGTFVVGMGGTGLLTFIVVPLQVERFNKKTGEVDTYYQASWSVGGIAQADIGMGAGAKVGFHGGIGLIWGDMPDASSLTGPAIGFTANIGYVHGLGVQAAFVMNTTTHHYNLVAMATYEVGASSTAAISGSAFYFMDLQQVIHFITDKTNFSQFGQELITQADLIRNNSAKTVTNISNTLTNTTVPSNG